jgi:nicotinamidase-related amidase
VKRVAKVCLIMAVCSMVLPSGGRTIAEGDGSLVLHTRSRATEAGNKAGEQQPKLAERRWAPKKTALIICDMWDDHWCKGAAARVGELSGPMNKVVKAARERGVLIVHAPSSTVAFYRDAPQRKLAQAAPFADTKSPLSTLPRWGTAWCYPDPSREPDLPIDDSDMGCDCAEKCEIREAWKRQTDAIDIAEGDAITDNGQELFNLFAERGIEHVMIMGVHLNMCVLGRPFAIRQLVQQEVDVVLVRDLTDTMYNHEKRPQVDHFSGTDLVVEHVEKYWCPTILSTDLVGGEPFRFREDTRPAKPAGAGAQ